MPAPLLPHQMSGSLFETLTQMHEQAYFNEELNLRLNLEAESGEDSAFDRVMQLDLPNERNLNSQSEFFIEEANSVEIGTRCQALVIPECQSLPCQSGFEGELFFDASKIEAALVERYLVYMKGVWPSMFDYREEIAL